MKLKTKCVEFGIRTYLSSINVGFSILQFASDFHLIENPCYLIELEFINSDLKSKIWILLVHKSVLIELILFENSFELILNKFIMNFLQIDHEQTTNYEIFLQSWLSITIYVKSRPYYYLENFVAIFVDPCRSL
jgi:hypothetical protein